MLLVFNGELPPLRTRILGHDFASNGCALLEALRASSSNLTVDHVSETAIDVTIQDSLFVVTVLRKTFDLFAFDSHCAFVFFNAMAIENANFNNGTVRAWRHAHGGVTNVGRLFTEDGAQKLFFRRHRAFALRRDLADKNVARMHFSTDVNDTSFVEVLQCFFRNVRNVACDFLRSKLRVTSSNFEFLDVDRGKDVVRNDLLGKKNRIFVVVAVPRHKRDEHVTAKSQVAQISRRTISDDVALTDRITNAYKRTLIDAGALVRALELLQTIDINARLRRIEVFGSADNDTCCVNLIDDTTATSGNSGTRVTSNNCFHTCSDERSFSAYQRHGLTLHVRAHESAVRVVVFKERNKCCSNRNQLLRRNIHQIHVFTRSHHHFTGMTADDEFVNETAMLIQLNVCLSNRVLRFFHGREVDNVVRYLAIDNLTVRAFDKAVLVDAGKSCE